MFKTCERGHDLTAEGAYHYNNSGARECRECAIITRGYKRKERAIRGTFDKSITKR